MSLENKRDNSRFLIFFREFPGVFFATKSGGAVQRTVTQRQPAGPGFGGPVNVPGPTTVSAVTVTKDYDTVRDTALEVWAKQWDLGVHVELTLVVQPVTVAGVPDGKPDTYAGCALVEFSKPDVDRQGGGVAVLSIQVQPSRLL